MRVSRQLRSILDEDYLFQREMNLLRSFLSQTPNAGPFWSLYGEFDVWKTR